jgi:molybdate transport system substrate-binding protein
VRRATALAVFPLLAAGCGGGGHRLTVYAASSLTGVFRQLDPKARFDFAGSDALAFQLEQGAKADVYASASPRYAQELFSKGLLERPHVFATNRLVFIVPGSNATRPSLGQLMKPGLKLVLAAKGVPAGDYARAVISHFCKTIYAIGRCPRARVVSEEQDVKGVVTKIRLGEADAGFVYATDARAAGGDVKAKLVPRYLQPPIRYEIAVLRDARNADVASRFVRLVLGPKGRAALQAAGFGVP